MKKRKIFFLAPLLLLALASCNNSTTNDEVLKTLSFNINKKNNEATVVGLVDKTQTLVKIPEKVVVDGTSYNVTEITSSCFASNTTIEKVVLPNSLEKIGDQAFARCTNLRYVKFGSNLTTIDNYAFDKCQSLINVELPNSVTSLGYGAFKNCTSLVHFRLPDNLNVLKGQTFYGDTKLKTIYANKLEKLGNGDFYNASALSEVYYQSTDFTYEQGNDNSYFTKITPTYGANLSTSGLGDTYYFTFDNQAHTASISGARDLSLTDAVIPSEVTFLDQTYTVTSIYKYAFYKSNVSSVTLCDTISYLDSYSFAYSKISNFDTNKVQTVGSYAFYNCQDLKNINYSETVTSIQSYAMAECVSLKEVVLPLKLTSLSTGLFNNDVLLDNVTIQTGVSLINSDSFKGCTAFKTLYYTGTEEQYSKIGINDSIIKASTVICNHEI